jgi:hypothetical protein
MLAISKLLETHYYQDRFGMFIVYGESGIGKSVYVIKAFQEVGLDWKKHMFFRPEEFIQVVKDAYFKRKRIKALCVDDAGFGLFAWNWNKPFVRAFVQFINVARTVVANIILTTPNPCMVVKKLTTLDAYFVKVMRAKAPNDGAYARLAKGYKNIMMPSGMRRIRVLFEDYFNAWLPDDVYSEYYEYRYGYVYDTMSNMFNSLYKTGKTVTEYSSEDD